MPNKTDRILSYLPHTFRALPKPTALYAVADAFGNELLSAENSLADVMRAHWIDHADKSAELIRDLACIAALYGLAPRGVSLDSQSSIGLKTCPPLPADESIEEFREHIKRYIRTFLDGTVTVQGVLRIVAEALGIRIADNYAQMDTWWTRGKDDLITIVPRGEDAARLLFGFDIGTVSGDPARNAQVTGTIDLSSPTDLRGASMLRLKIDTAAPVTIDLASRIPNLAAATLDQVVSAINTALGKPIADHDGKHLTLASSLDGSTSRLEIQEVELDAGPRLLGLSPLTCQGSDAQAARVTGAVDLGGGVDLSETRYLRLLVDGTHIAEIDCAGSTALVTTLDEIVAAINAEFGFDIASHDGHFLMLTSQTTGFNSSITIQAPAAQGAAQSLFGSVPLFHVGRDAQPAEVVGTRDLSLGMDLSDRASINICVDNGPLIIVNCAGADPAHTLLPEIVNALNSELGGTVASHDGRFIRLTSPTTGATSKIAFEPLPPDEDATEIIFGIAPRIYLGQAGTHAQLVGHADLSAGVDLGAKHMIQVAFDGGASVEVNARSQATNLRNVTLDELVAAVNVTLGQSLAAHDGKHLTLTSPISGADSRLSIKPLETTLHRRFVTRAFITDEAAQAVFGFIKKEEHGKGAIRARINGENDLSRGVDLRDAHYLRIAVDGQPAREIDCATHSPRPRLAMPDEIVTAINDVLGVGVASQDGSRITLNSTIEGSESRIAFEVPRSEDASNVLLGVEPITVRGSDATRVNFVGMVDLSANVDLSVVSHVKIGVDSESPVEITCAGADPAQTTLNEIVMAINVALGKVVARHDGKRISLASSLNGANSRIEFAAPDQPDATWMIFGITAPRSYHGADPKPARIIGIRNLSGGVDLRVTWFLRLVINGQSPQNVDCAAGAVDPSHTSIDEVVTAINQELGSTVASSDGVHLILTSPTVGVSSRLDLQLYASGDARTQLFGKVPKVTTGEAPVPAILTGEVDLLSPVNLNERQVIRLAVDDGRPVDIDISGAAPEITFLDEIIAKINEAFPDFPNFASATDDDRLKLTSPTAGGNSKLEVLPLRALEMIEYPPEMIENPPLQVQHGDGWHIDNEGAAEVDIDVEILAPHGAVGVMLVNRVESWGIRLRVVILPGEKIHLWREPDTKVQAVLTDINGDVHAIPASDILIESIGAQDWLAERALRLPLGKSDWTYMDCDGARFNRDHFNDAYFAGGSCYERGVFNISRFVSRGNKIDPVVFSPTPPLSDAPVEISIRWPRHRQGTFVVNLPSDLPEQFGGRFNTARFGGGVDAAETYEDVVTEPANDSNHWVQRLAGSNLVEAHIVPRVPIGFQGMAIPFRYPRLRTLIGGTDIEPARLYLAEDDVPGFIELRAREPGAWGNAIGVIARQAGPARFDVTVAFQGGHFENARQVALAGRIFTPDEYPLAALAEELLKPGPVGVLQAKAAGVHADVIRERANLFNTHKH